jgi:methionyl-tRNA formyltransferase
MRIGFAGCHEISWFCLKKICERARASSGVAVVAALNLPDDAGRKHSAFMPFDDIAADYGVPLHKVASLSSDDSLQLLRSLRLDVLFVIGWHRIVPQSVIDCAPLCLGVHSSLLPRDRGSSPINWALIRGESTGGLSLFHLTEGVDSGDLVGQGSFAMGPDTTCKEAYDSATVVALQLIEEHWPALVAGSVPRHPQDETMATYNARRRPEDGDLDWQLPVQTLHNWVRALTHPYPGAFTTYRGRRLHLWRSAVDPRPTEEPPGTVIGDANDPDAIVISAEGGRLRVLSLGFAGEPACTAPVFRALYLPMDGERVGGGA